MVLGKALTSPDNKKKHVMLQEVMQPVTKPHAERRAKESDELLSGDSGGVQGGFQVCLVCSQAVRFFPLPQPFLISPARLYDVDADRCHAPTAGGFQRHAVNQCY
jgi:hypothetical protein